MEVARRVLATTPLIDGHNDLPWLIYANPEAPGDLSSYDLRGRAPGHTDIERLRTGMVGAQFWAVYVPPEAVEEGAARVLMEVLDLTRRMILLYPEHLQQAFSASDVERIFGAGRVASILGMEGGHALENSLGVLRVIFEMGVRYLTLTHNNTTDWADSATDEPRHGGLSTFGVEVIREMNRLGMLADLSHASDATMSHVLDVSEAPVIFSHSSARALTDHPRNVPDSILRRMPGNGGLVMVTFVPFFVNDETMRHMESPHSVPEEAPPATLADVADHIDHVRRVAGVDHVGIGSDFDGMPSAPVGLEDVSTYPALFAELSRRGWPEEDLRKLAGENLLRAWREGEAVARRLQREGG
jgi:membrane dipeptidase